MTMPAVKVSRKECITVHSEVRPGVHLSLISFVQSPAISRPSQQDPRSSISLCWAAQLIWILQQQQLLLPPSPPHGPLHFYAIKDQFFAAIDLPPRKKLLGKPCCQRIRARGTFFPFCSLQLMRQSSRGYYHGLVKASGRCAGPSFLLLGIEYRLANANEAE